MQWASCGTAVIVFEASGAYHRDLVRLLSRQGLTFAKVNPWQARRFAEATERVAKTDRIGAEMLARMLLPTNGPTPCRVTDQSETGRQPEIGCCKVE